MKLNTKNIIAVTALLLGITACEQNFEEFEVQGSTATPVAISESAVQSEALPGEIKLTWTAPAEDFAYMQIRYNDPLQKKEICKIVSKGTTELLIENTRARFGDYTFNFQTFNANHEGSEVTQVKARSGAAPTTTTETRTKVSLTEDQLKTDNQEPTEGHIRNLLDGKNSTFFHTRWSSPQVPLPQYIQIDFKEEHQDFAIQYTTRDTGNTDGFPTLADLQISSDGENWTTVATLTGLPATKTTQYVSDYVQPGQKFKHFRFLVKASSQNKNYFHMAEFAFFDTVISVYDPETVPLD